MRTIEQFRAFALLQGDRTYDYGDIFNCAMAQFLKAEGLQIATVGGTEVHFLGGSVRTFVRPLEQALIPNDRDIRFASWAKLAERLERLSGDIFV